MDIRVIFELGVDKGRCKIQNQNQNQTKIEVQGGLEEGSPGDDRFILVVMRMQGGHIHVLRSCRKSEHRSGALS